VEDTMKNRAVPAGEFKNSCLKLMEEVSKHGIPITVTKRGKPLVRVVPVRAPEARRTLLGTVVHEDDDVFSTGESWEAER
jgi:prevent-host-death family protein